MGISIDGPLLYEYVGQSDIRGRYTAVELQTNSRSNMRLSSQIE